MNDNEIKSYMRVDLSNVTDFEVKGCLFEAQRGARILVSKEAIPDFTRVCRQQGLDLDYGDRPGSKDG